MILRFYGPGALEPDFQVAPTVGMALIPAGGDVDLYERHGGIAGHVARGLNLLDYFRRVRNDNVERRRADNSDPYYFRPAANEHSDLDPSTAGAAARRKLRVASKKVKMPYSRKRSRSSGGRSHSKRGRFSGKRLAKFVRAVVDQSTADNTLLNRLYTKIYIANTPVTWYGAYRGLGQGERRALAMGASNSQTTPVENALCNCTGGSVKHTLANNELVPIHVTVWECYPRMAIPAYEVATGGTTASAFPTIVGELPGLFAGGFSTSYDYSPFTGDSTSATPGITPFDSVDWVRWMRITNRKGYTRVLQPGESFSWTVRIPRREFRVKDGEYTGTTFTPLMYYTRDMQGLYLIRLTTPLGFDSGNAESVGYGTPALDYSREARFKYYRPTTTTRNFDLAADDATPYTGINWTMANEGDAQLEVDA